MTTRNSDNPQTLGSNLVETLQGSEMERKFEAAGMGSEGYMAFSLAKSNDEKMKFFTRILGAEYIKKFAQANDTEYPIFAINNLYVAWAGTK